MSHYVFKKFRPFHTFISKCILFEKEEGLQSLLDTFRGTPEKQAEFFIMQEWRGLHA